MRLDLDADELTLLADSRVFEGVERQQLEPLLTGLGARMRRYRKDEVIRRMGDVLDFYPMVLSGMVKATLLQGGENREVARFAPGESFAEAVPAKLHRCPVNIWALEKTKLLCIPAETLEQAQEPEAVKVRENLANEMPYKVMRLALNLHVLGEPRLADRIMAYLRTLPENDDGTVTVPLTRKDWASYLRVSDKSLIRELRTLQEEGVLEVNRRKIKVIADATGFGIDLSDELRNNIGGDR